MRFSRRAAIIVVAFVLVCAITAAVAVAGFKVSTLAASLGRLVSYSEVIQTHVKAADLEALATDIVHLDDLTQETLVAASDPYLSATLDGLPFVGRHLDAARTIASAAAGLTASARPLAAVLPRLDPDVLVTDGRYDVGALSDLDSALRDLSAQLAVSNKPIGGIDLDGLDERFVSAIDELAPALRGAQSLVEQVEPLVGILPIVLSNPEQRTWFVALQNLTEARGTGGLVGAYSVLSIDDGVISMTKSGSDKDLIPTEVPFDGVPESYTSLWGTSMRDFRSMNRSANFPYTGRLISNEWNAVSGEDVDGVLAFGQGIVQYMLAATGPIEIDGTTVDAENVVEFLSLGVYQKYPDVADKNEFVAQLVAEIFTRLQAGDFDLESLLSATAATPTSDRLQAWSPHADVQQQIVDAGYDGSISTEYGPNTVVTVNNGGGNKLEQFLHMSIDYDLGDCIPDAYTRVGSVVITLTNDAPTSGLPEYVTPRLDRDGAAVGSNLEFVSVYAPINSGGYDASLDGDDVSAYLGMESGRPLYLIPVELAPGQTREIVINWEEPIVGPSVIDILGSDPSVTVAPSLNPIEVNAPRADACL